MPSLQRAQATVAALCLQAADRGWMRLKEWGVVIAARWNLMGLLRPLPDAGHRLAHFNKSIPKYCTHAEPGELPESAVVRGLVMILCRGQINGETELLHLLDNNAGTAFQFEDEWRDFIAFCGSQRQLARNEFGSDGK